MLSILKDTHSQGAAVLNVCRGFNHSLVDLYVVELLDANLRENKISELNMINLIVM